MPPLTELLLVLYFRRALIKILGGDKINWYIYYKIDVYTAVVNVDAYVVHSFCLAARPVEELKYLNY